MNTDANSHIAIAREKDGAVSIMTVHGHSVVYKVNVTPAEAMRLAIKLLDTIKGELG